MKDTPVFLMPVKIGGGEQELTHLRIAVDSIKRQTDENWILVIVDDYSNDRNVYDALDKIQEELKDKVHVIYSDKNYGTGAARNKGVLFAKEIGAPFILFNDSDDVSDPRRLELTRKAFDADASVNVVYSSFDVIDQNGQLVPLDQINKSVKEIIDGHKADIVEGENAWIGIVTKKKYTNLTSCTAVRTSLAAEELFPSLSVSEDCHTWMRYGAHPGKFVFLREIKGSYRICIGTESRSRSANANFYEQMYKVDSAGFEAALTIAKKYGTMGGWDEKDLRCAFHVRLALSLLYGGSEEFCRASLAISKAISEEKTLLYIDALSCEPQSRFRIKELLN